MVKECPETKEINLKTGRCIKKCNSDQIRKAETGRCIKKCNTNQIRNPLTGRCKKRVPSKRKSPKRKSPKRKSPKRKSPKRKTPKRKSPKRKSPKRKTPKRKSPKRKTPKLLKDNNLFVTKSGNYERKINIGRSIEFLKSKNLCRKKNNLKICKIIDIYNSKNQLFPPNYFISKELGKGAYGTAYLLCDVLSTKCDKVLKYTNKSSEYVFLKETDIHKKFTDIGIAPKFINGQYFPDDRSFVTIMGRVDTTLHDYLSSDLTKREVEKVFKKIEKLLIKMKKNHLIHGDFHAGNIGLIQNANSIEPSLIDFGFSKKLKNIGDLDEVEYLQLFRTIHYNGFFRGEKKFKPEVKVIAEKLAKNLYIKRFGEKYVEEVSKLNFKKMENKLVSLLYKIESKK